MQIHAYNYKYSSRVATYIYIYMEMYVFARAKRARIFSQPRARYYGVYFSNMLLRTRKETL